MQARRRAAALGAVAVLSASLAGTLVATTGSASADSSTTSADGSVTQTKTVTRDNLVGGTQTVTDSRTVSVTVSQTTNLRSQRVQVSWTGAHPTGYVEPNPNSTDARLQEYPMLLIECRGVDDAPTTPAVDQLSPQTCWTQNPSRERYQETRNYSALFPPYRLDEYATAADREAVVGDPPQCTDDDAPVQHRVPFIAANGTDYAGDCAGDPPESTGGDVTANNPGNTTYAATGTDGTGSAQFTVWTDQDNASLGCNDTTPCSLVAVPIMGISCDPDAAALPAADRPSNYNDSKGNSQEPAAAQACAAAGLAAPGSVAEGQAATSTSLAVTGQLWWSASNWRNKIVFPLTFAPSASACALVTNLPQAQVYGSELMAQATGQWTPALCGPSATYSLKHVQTGEPQARSLLDTGNIDAAFVTNAPSDGYQLPTVNAPAAVTGFAISYVIDGPNGQPYTSLKLDARLLAKLLTESYTAIPDISEEDPALASNPTNIAFDPEFLALNPGLTGVLKHDVNLDFQSLASMIYPSSQSDVMYALTSYIAADPEARAWLDGEPDPWGMRVNPAYQTNFGGNNLHSTFSLPVYQWPLLDTFVPPVLAGGASSNVCYHDDPSPYLGLIAAPTVRIENIVQDMVIASPTSTIACTNPGTPEEKLASNGPQPVGQRFLLGVVPIADADRQQLSMAALETQTSSSAPDKFTDTTGRTFVAPTDASMVAAAQTVVADTSHSIFSIPYATLRANDPTAYPGTMIVNAAMHTQGVDAQDASDYASLLTFIAGPAQVPGEQNGQLAPGYIPITSPGLTQLDAYTLAAAQAVAAQQGTVPPLIPAAATPSSSPSAVATKAATAAAKTTSPAAPSAAATRAAATAPSTTQAVVPGIPAAALESKAPVPVPSAPTVQVAPPALGGSQAPAANTTATPANDAGGVGLVVPLLLALSLITGAAAFGTVRTGGSSKP